MTVNESRALWRLRRDKELGGLLYHYKESRGKSYHNLAVATGLTEYLLRGCFERPLIARLEHLLLLFDALDVSLEDRVKFVQPESVQSR